MATVFVGTYTEHLDHVDGHGEGIYVLTLECGNLSLEHVTGGLPNPSFIHVDPVANRLYAVSEVMEYEGLPQGAAQSFIIDPNSRQLTVLNQRSIPGQAPCFVSQTDGHVLIANYMGGSVTVVRLTSEGALGNITNHILHQGSGPNEARQQSPHPHAILPHPSGRCILVPDLGTDAVVEYEFDNRTGKLKTIGRPVHVQPGAGPRHVSFSPARPHAYLINELDSTITVLSRESAGLRAVQTVSALPVSFKGTPSGADIHVHPSGQFLYASLRGPGSLVCLQIDPESGRLSNPEWTSTLGHTPRNFALSPSGDSLIVANQDSDSLVAYRVDARTGQLSGPTDVAEVPSPACVRIVP